MSSALFAVSGSGWECSAPQGPELHSKSLTSSEKREYEDLAMERYGCPWHGHGRLRFGRGQHRACEH